MADEFFHATMNDHGDEFAFDRGGKYEKLDERGAPQQRLAAGEFVGWEISDVPELAASKAPEAATFAILKNYVNDTGDATGHHIDSLTVNIYRLEREPDIDASTAVAGDFAVIEEVRYRRPSETPVEGERVHVVDLPGRVLSDVELAYLPTRIGSQDVITEWADAVQEAIRNVIDGGDYPEDVVEWADVDRPNPEAYEAHPAAR